MKQLEEQKRIHDAETGTLKAKLVELLAEIDTRIKEQEAQRNAYNSLYDKMQAENQALKSELEKHSAGVVARFEGEAATSTVLRIENEKGVLVFAGKANTIKYGQAYEVLILQKET